MFKQLYLSQPLPDQIGFKGTWEPWLRLVYLPAKLLTYFGFSDLLAIRFLAIGCSTIATFLLIKMARVNGRDDRLFKTTSLPLPLPSAQGSDKSQRPSLFMSPISVVSTFVI